MAKQAKHFVRVAVRDGQPVRIKFCPGCNQDKLVSDDRATTEFWINTYHPDGRVRSWRPLCKSCHRAALRKKYRETPREVRSERNHREYEAMRQDPERKERQRIKDRDRARKYRQDPVKAEKSRARVRAHHARQRAEAGEEVNAEQRMRYRLRQERLGKAARVVKKSRWVDTPLKKLPAGPFRAWLLHYQLTVGLRGDSLAQDLDINERRVRMVLSRGQELVHIEVVDRALLNAQVQVEVNGVTVFGLEDLYPDWPQARGLTG